MDTMKEFGFYAIALAAVAFFMKRDVWPFCMEMIRQSRSEAHERHMKMLGLLDKLTDQVTTQRQQSIEALHGLTVQMSELAATVANVARMVSSMAEHIEQHHSSTRQR
jgi:hypothetical protein